MKVYIAGKITGDPDYKNRFEAGKLALEREGHTVLNPADLPAGMDNKDYMRICFAMIDVADFAAFLPGWERSKGASLEHAYCQYTNKQTFYLGSSTLYNIIDGLQRLGIYVEGGESNA